MSAAAVWRAVTSLPGRIAISAGLLAAVLASVDLGAVIDSLAAANPALLVAALATIVLALAVGALRWHPLLASAGVPTGVGASLRAYFAGTFANNLLPTGFGGDFVRGWLVARSGPPLARALASVLFDRASSLGCLILLGWIGVLVDSDAIPGDLVVALAVVTAACLAAGIAVLATLARRGLGRLVPAALRPWAAEIAAVLRGTLGDRPLQLELLILGLLFQGLMVLALTLIAEALGLAIPFSVLAVVAPLVLIATLLPISIAGFGVREGSFVTLLGTAGVSAGDATLLSLLSVAATALASVPGGFALGFHAGAGFRVPDPDPPLEEPGPAGADGVAGR